MKKMILKSTVTFKIILNIKRLHRKQSSVSIIRVAESAVIFCFFEFAQFTAEPAYFASSSVVKLGNVRFNVQ